MATTHEECLTAFVGELERYDASFSASVDDFEGDEFRIGVDHPLNVVATQLESFYPASKLPVTPRHAFRKLLKAAGPQPTWESVEEAIEELTVWAAAELTRKQTNDLQNTKVIFTNVRSFSNENGTPQAFDVFLAHNSSDKAMVVELKRLIQASHHENGEHLTAWLDKDELRPGIPRQKLIEEGIHNSKSIVVLVAADGLGPCEVEEMYAALDLAFRDGRPVIPVLLPGAPAAPKLPMFLGNRTWVDLRSGIEGDEFDKLTWGITGKKSVASSTQQSQSLLSPTIKTPERCFPTIVTTLPAVYQCICVQGNDFFSVTWDSTNCVEVNRQKVTSAYAARAMSDWESYAPETYRNLYPGFAGDRKERSGNNFIIEELIETTEDELPQVGVATPSLSQLEHAIMPGNQNQIETGGPKRFAFALSFPGEHRDFVLALANELANKFGKDRVFYDEWYEHELAGTDGDLTLRKMYENAELVVPFFSKFYEKPWCGLEWGTIRVILLERRKERSVVPVHLDDTAIPGWTSVDFGIKLRERSPKEIAAVIFNSHLQRISTAPEATDVASEKISLDFIGSTTHGGSSGANYGSVYLPKSPMKLTDQIRDDFLAGAFQSIRKYFTRGISQVQENGQGLSARMQEKNSSDFTCKVYRNGDTKCQCRIWLGDDLGSGIYFSDASGILANDNSYNDCLRVELKGGELVLTGWASSFGNQSANESSPSDAAVILWNRFIKPLER